MHRLIPSRFQQILKRYRNEGRRRPRVTESPMYRGVEPLEPRVLLSTVNLFAANLYQADGVTSLPLDSEILLIADADADGDFGDLSDPNAFADGVDAVVLARSGTNDTDGDGTHRGVFVFDPDPAIVGNQMAVVWYNKPSGDVSPGPVIEFGVFRTNDVIDNSDTAWVVPDAPDTIALNFATVNQGGSNDESAGTANMTTTDINTAPVITSNGGGDDADIDIPENTTAVTNVEADDDSDAEGAGLLYTLSGGADQALFSIDADTGELAFIAAPDFEAPADADTDNVYEVQVTVTDSGGLSDIQDLAVMVTDEDDNDPPVADDAAVQVDQDTVLVDAVTAVDPDGDPLTFMVVSGPTQGVLTDFDVNTGDYSYTPNAGFFGQDSFTFSANDGQADSNVATVDITVNEVIQPDFVLVDGDKLEFIDPDGSTFKIDVKWMGDAGSVEIRLSDNGYFGQIDILGGAPTTMIKMSAAKGADGISQIFGGIASDGPIARLSAKNVQVTGEDTNGNGSPNGRGRIDIAGDLDRFDGGILTGVDVDIMGHVGRVKLKSKNGPSFENSFVRADTADNIDLGLVRTVNGGTDLGIEVSALPPKVKFTSFETSERVKLKIDGVSLLAGNELRNGDAVIRIV